MLTQVLLQQIPQSLGGVDVHLSAGVLSLTVVDCLVLVAYPTQELVDAILVGVDFGPTLDQPFDERLNGGRLYVSKVLDNVNGVKRVSNPTPHSPNLAIARRVSASSVN